ncbi:MAG: hypothetical protein H6765_05895 [Candidatus Peribacteria bacterium]|nr:MAG: hypothetical protein H6765_05895 [Candidatus Peribacteria bacterium]
MYYNNYHNKEGYYAHNPVDNRVETANSGKRRIGIVEDDTGLADSCGVNNLGVGTIDGLYECLGADNDKDSDRIVE